MGFFDFISDVGSWFADPIGNAFGLKSGGSLFSSAMGNPFSLLNLPDDFRNDWSKIKHWLTPDMRRDRQVSTNSATTAQRIIYGTTRVSGQLAYVESMGDGNANLHLVFILAAHPVAGFGEIYLDETLITDPQYADKVYYELFDGTQAAACATLVEASRSNSATGAGLWTDRHIGYGRAYIYLRLTYDQTAFPAGIPTPKVVVHGKPVYDPRTGTTGLSSNPALCIRDYMTIPASLGGGGFEAWEIDDNAVIAAANICDQTVTGDWGSEKRYQLDGVVSLDTTPAKIVGDMLTAMAGQPLYSDGVWKLFAGSYTSPVVVVDESWLNGGISFRVGTDKSSRVNTVKGTFIDPNDKWAEKAYPIVPAGNAPPNAAFWSAVSTPNYSSASTYAYGNYVTYGDTAYRALSAVPAGTTPPDGSYWAAVEEYDSSQTYTTTHIVQRGGLVYQAIASVPVNNPYIDQDGGEELLATLNLPFTVSPHAAQRLAQILLKKSRRGFSLTYPCNMLAFNLQPMDVIAVNCDLLGLTSATFRVLSWEFSASKGVTLSLGQDDADVWSDDTTIPLTETPLTKLPDPRVVYPPSSLTVSESLYATNVASAIKVRADLSWVAGGSSVTRYEVQSWFSGDTGWSDTTTVSVTAATLWDVQTGPYRVRVRGVNGINAKSAWVEATGIIVGKTAPPPACSTFLVFRQPDGTRQFTWTIDAPLDLAGFRIRYASGTDGEWSSMTPLHDGLLTSSPYETNQLPAGAYVFAIISEDTSGNQSPANYIETTLEDPRLADVIVDRYPHSEQWPGTLTNCYRDERGYLVAADQKTWADFAADGVTWADWHAWARNPYPTITYTDEVIDIGIAVPFTPSVSVQADGAVAVEMRTSDDGSTWSAYAAPGFVIKRYVQFRISVTNATGLAVLKAATIYLSGKPVVVEINDLATSGLTGSYRIGTGDFRIPVAGRFAKINTVFLTLQNVGAGWSYELIDKANTYGPRIKIYNASNALADATIDAYIKGV